MKRSLIKDLNFRGLIFLICFASTTLTNVSSSTLSWDFAISLKTKMLFYDEYWQEVTSSAHQFDQLSALAFDDTEDLLYFNDQQRQNGSIYSLKLPTSAEDHHIIEKLLQRVGGEIVRGMAYDPLDRNLFWSDEVQRKIYFVSIDPNTETMLPKVFIDFSSEDGDAKPYGLAIDVCRRKLYWTNSNFKNASVERIDLDGHGRTVIASSNLYLPHGIVIDQLSDRIYWVNDMPGIHFVVESSQLDGSDRQIVVRGQNIDPFNLAVTKDTIYWTDLRNNAVWSHAKHANRDTANSDIPLEPRKVMTFSEKVHGIVARNHFYQTLKNDPHCAEVVDKIMQRNLAPKVTQSPVDKMLEQLQRDYCLNGGRFLPEKDICICKMGFKGVRCESSECHNYCVHGTCAISTMGFPKCYCQVGFFGERCQTSKCTSYCFNEGHCTVDSNSGDPNCACGQNFGGQRCEHNSTEICALFCRILKHEPNANVPFGCHDICEELTLRLENGADLYAIPAYQHLEVCRSSSIWTGYVIITLVAGTIACLALIALIVHGLRRIYKPARPRIKKTFVVRKQTRTNSASDTPLTNRPLATEQCEITIENCCNMNICETPCFDPKLTLSDHEGKSNVKDDKKILIHSMEDDLY